jgi:tetratricopeptide (TPR) repeat protein
MRPDNYFAWEKLLLVYYDLRDFQKLMERGKECATKFNRSFLAKILYANGALENKSYAIALEELRKASILAGNNKEMLLQVLTMQADVYYRMKDFKRSFEIFEEALKENGEDLTVLNNYAYYLAEQNIKLREAEEMAKKVIEKEKDNNTFLDTYAWVLYKKGRLKEAANVMEKIVNSDDKPDAEWYEHYGYILKKRRNCREAIIKWETALKLDTTKTDLKEEIKSCKSSH